MLGFRLMISVCLCSVLMATECGPSQTSGGGRTISYGRNAREAYENALLEFRRENCIDAEPAFRRIRREYPYSRFAALAELRVADCKFQLDQFAEAISAYRQFVRFRPSHSQVPYARFRIAESHYEQIPSEWLLSPPTYERDPSAVNEALRQLRRYILDFPDDERVEDANELVKECLKILAEHELYAADFYSDRDAHSAVVMRLQTLLASYDGSGLESEALLMLGQTYLKMNDRAHAREAFQQLVERFPESDEVDEAREELEELGPGA